MATRGQKPKPTAIKVLEGNRSKKALPKNEPKPLLGSEPPEAPDWLCDIGRAEWARLSRQLWLNGLLGLEDIQTFAAYCDHFARAVSYRGLLAEAAAEEARVLRARAAWEAFGKDEDRPEPKTSGQGTLVPNATGGWIPNPLIALANVSLREMMKAATEFGLTPSSRARVNVPRGSGADLPGPKDADKPGPRPADFLNRGPRLVSSRT